MTNPQKPKRVRVEPAPAKTLQPREPYEVPEYVRCFLHEIIERTLESEADNAICDLLSIGELVSHHPGLRAEAKAFAGLCAFDEMVQNFRRAKATQ